MRKSNRLGCFTGVGIVAAFITIVVIAGYAYATGGLLYNPGPLNAQPGEMLGGAASHADTGGNCKACHTAPWESETMADRCVKCHIEVGNQVQVESSLHGSMMRGNSNLTCRNCHPEHRGADASLTVMETGSFPHEAVGFSLRGHQLTARRDPFSCADCHALDITTFSLDTCKTCHLQLDAAFVAAHSNSYGDACLGCHDGVDRFGKGFRHPASFKLEGGHAQVACDKCHFAAKTLADFKSAPIDCFSCHQRDDEHRGQFGTDCVACHKTDRWENATFDHNQFKFPLTGGHTGLACEKCHASGQFAGLSSNCVSCHTDPASHAGMFGTDCAACHTTNDWFAPFTGRHPAIAEDGGSGVNHGNTACRTCHTVNLSTATCLACHNSNNPEGGGENEGSGDH